MIWCWANDLDIGPTLNHHHIEYNYYIMLFISTFYVLLCHSGYASNHFTAYLMQSVGRPSQCDAAVGLILSLICRVVLTLGKRWAAFLADWSSLSSLIKVQLFKTDYLSRKYNILLRLGH